MRDWCFVLDLTSAHAAKEIGDVLKETSLDVDVMKSSAQIWCYANSEIEVREAEASVRKLLIARSLWAGAVQREPSIRVWREARHLYVEPEHPGEDPDTGEVFIDCDLDPADIRWRVRLELESVFEFRRVRKQLPSLGRQVIGTANRSIDLAARDQTDADEIAARARLLEGVAAVETREIRGRLRRWWLRQQLAGNYSNVPDDSGPRMYHFDFGSAGHGGGGGGGDGGGGHGGGGGGHGH